MAEKPIPSEGADALLHIAEDVGKAIGAGGAVVESGYATEVAKLTETALGHQGVDEAGGALISPGAGVDSGVPVASPERSPMRLTDLTHMRSLAELLDGSEAGTVDSVELSRAFAGLERTYGPYNLEEVSASYKPGAVHDGRPLPGRIVLTARIRDELGNDAGELRRSFRRGDDGKLVVHNESIKLDRGFRGNGFGTALTGSLENWYRASGADRIELLADMDDGGYAWARAGFDWDPRLFARTKVEMVEHMDGVVADIERAITNGIGDPLGHLDDIAQIEAYQDRLRAGLLSAPSPSELVTTSGSDGTLGERIMRGSSWYGMKKL